MRRRARGALQPKRMSAHLHQALRPAVRELDAARFHHHAHHAAVPLARIGTHQLTNCKIDVCVRPTHIEFRSPAKDACVYELCVTHGHFWNEIAGRDTAQTQLAAAL